ncbi:olfactory receptor 6X1-like [Rhinophrynus dorsalis]
MDFKVFAKILATRLKQYLLKLIDPEQNGFTPGSLLSTILRDHIIVPVTICITQYYFSGAITVVECFLLTVMSYDRYLAICIPLHYISIMSIKLCLHLVMSSWLIANIVSVIVIIPVSLLQFCGNNAIDHIYCDLAPLLEVSCSDTYVIETEGIILTVPIAMCPFLFIIMTYVSIFQRILRISSSTGRQKTFSTCSSHIIVVGTYYGILITKYTVPSRGHSLNVNKFISILYTVLTPLFNPIIYSLRNQEIRTELNKWISITRND